MVNKALILKEMGISTWRLKPSEKLTPMIDSPSKKEIKNMAASYPIWTLVVDDVSSFSSLFQHIQKMIQNFGVEIQVITFDQSVNAEDIRGDFLISFGDRSSQFFSGEPSLVHELREILFETTNALQQEIPVIATFGLKDLYQNPLKKQQLWTDLIFARNVFLDTMV